MWDIKLNAALHYVAKNSVHPATSSD